MCWQRRRPLLFPMARPFDLQFEITMTTRKVYSATRSGSSKSWSPPRRVLQHRSSNHTRQQTGPTKQRMEWVSFNHPTLLLLLHPALALILAFLLQSFDHHSLLLLRIRVLRHASFDPISPIAYCVVKSSASSWSCGRHPIVLD